MQERCWGLFLAVFFAVFPALSDGFHHSFRLVPLEFLGNRFRDNLSEAAADKALPARVCPDISAWCHRHGGWRHGDGRNHKPKIWRKLTLHYFDASSCFA